MKYVRGGEKIKNILEKISVNAGSKYIEAGFLEGATYPDGLPVASVAFWNEFGTMIEVAAKESMTIYRKIKKNGDFAKLGRFVKKSESNFATSHAVPAHTINIPARPFFRMTIEKNKEKWIRISIKLLQENNYKIDFVLKEIGKMIQEDIQETIVNFTTPENATSTKRKKGRDSPLRDTKHMLFSVNYRLENGTPANSQ